MDLAFSYSVTDLDGSTAAGSLVITLKDDGPVATGATVTGTVEEEHLPAGNEDTDPAEDEDTLADFNVTTAVATGSLGTLLNFGADQPGTFSLSSDTSGLSALTSGGDPVVYDVSGNTLTGFIDEDLSGTLNAGDTTVFTLVLVGDSYTFTLFEQLDHHPIAAADDIEGLLVIDFSSVIEASDADGDAITLGQGAFTLRVIDDIPEFTEAQNAIIANAVITVIGSFNAAAGADDPGTFTITDFTDLEGITETLSPDGTVLTATIDGSGDPSDPSDDTVFCALTVNPDGTYAFDLVTPRPVIEEIIPGSEFVPGPFVETIDATATGGTVVTFDGLLFTDAGTVANPINDPNVGPGSDDDLGPNGVGFGVRGGQSQNINDNQGFAAAFSIAVSTFTFLLDQQGNTSSTTITWQAFKDGALVGEDLVGVTLSLPSGSDLASFTIDFGGELDEVVIRFDHPAQNDSLRIQNFSFTRTLLPEDQLLAYDIALTDADGDSTTLLVTDYDGDGDDDTFSVDLLGGAPNGFTLIGTGAAEVLAGGSGNDMIEDGPGRDRIVGGDGLDSIILFADGETDVIAFNDISEAGDSVQGFDTGAPASGGDILDLADVLSGFAGSSVGDAVAGGFLSFTDSGAGGTDVLVDFDAASGFETLVTLDGIAFVDAATSQALLNDNIIVL